MSIYVFSISNNWSRFNKLRDCLAGSHLRGLLVIDHTGILLYSNYFNMKRESYLMNEDLVAGALIAINSVLKEGWDPDRILQSIVYNDGVILLESVGRIFCALYVKKEKKKYSTVSEKILPKFQRNLW